MAKQVEDVVTDDRVESLKTVKFGGYDKASVDYYIDELKEKHNKEVEELKANVNKLSEAVLSLKTMREVNMTESSKTIETLKKTNSEQESEIESLKEQIDLSLLFNIIFPVSIYISSKLSAYPFHLIDLQGAAFHITQIQQT